MGKTDGHQEFQTVNRLKVELLEAIAKLMEQEGISQSEVARRIGAQRYNINKVMRGKFPVTLDFLLKMAESIGLEVDMKFRKARK